MYMQLYIAMTMLLIYIVGVEQCAHARMNQLHTTTATQAAQR